jgi:hypothetical protein
VIPATKEDTMQAKAKTLSDETRAAVIAKVIEYVNETNYSRATRQLNAEGVPTLGGGRQWYVVVTRGVFLRESGKAGQAKARKLARKPTRAYAAKLAAEAAPAKPKAPKAAKPKGVK